MAQDIGVDDTQLQIARYGFIGLGNMGFEMAQNLAKKLPEGSSLAVCEIVESVRQKFLKLVPQASVQATPRDIAASSDVIITMLPAGHHVLEVFTNPETGLLSTKNQSKRKLFIDCSTIDVTSSKKAFEAVRESKLGDFVDAPVSGGPTGAKASTLTFMVGGDDLSVVSSIKPILLTMGTTFYHCGGPGAVLITKQVNNYLSGICMLGTAEAMNLGIRCGLDPVKLAGVINASTGRSYNSKEQNPVKGISPNSSASRNFEGGFAIELCAGVLRMAIDLGRQSGSKLPPSQGLLSTYENACKDPRCAGKDCRSVYKFVADLP